MKAACRKIFKAASKSRWGKDNKKRGGVQPPLANLCKFLNSEQPASEFEPAPLQTNNPRVIGLALPDLECTKKVAEKLQQPKTRQTLAYKKRGALSSKISREMMDAVDIWVFDLQEQDLDTPSSGEEDAVPEIISPSVEPDADNISVVEATLFEATLSTDAILEDAKEDDSPVPAFQAEEVGATLNEDATEMMEDALPEIFSPSGEVNTLNADAVSDTTAFNCKYFMIVILPLGKPCSTAKFFKAVRKLTTVGCVLPAFYAKMITRTGWKSLESRNLNTFKHTALKEGKKSVLARHPYLLRTTVGEARSIGQ